MCTRANKLSGDKQSWGMRVYLLLLPPIELKIAFNRSLSQVWNSPRFFSFSVYYSRLFDSTHHSNCLQNSLWWLISSYAATDFAESFTHPMRVQTEEVQSSMICTPSPCLSNFKEVWSEHQRWFRLVDFSLRYEWTTVSINWWYRIRFQFNEAWKRKLMKI
jgi:hypothetical protein